jgi:hypothetical protein
VKDNFQTLWMKKLGWCALWVFSQWVWVRSVKRMGLEVVLRSDALTRPLVSHGGIWFLLKFLISSNSTKMVVYPANNKFSTKVIFIWL